MMQYQSCLHLKSFDFIVLEGKYLEIITLLGNYPGNINILVILLKYKTVC